MTNTQDDSDELSVLLARGVRPASRFRPEIVAMQHRLNVLTATTATGADEALRRSRMTDLRKEIAVAAAERDDLHGVNSIEDDTETSMATPRHMSLGKNRR